MSAVKMRLLLFFVVSFTSAWSKVRRNMDKPTVLITNPTVLDSGLKLLNESGFRVIIVDKEDRQEIIKKANGVDALFWATGIKLDKEILDAAGPQMKTVGIMSAGFNHIDIEELKMRGIKAANTPGVLNDAVADTAVLLTLAASKRLRETRLAMESDQWVTHNLQWMLGQDMTNSTIGIIGFGSIGQTILKRFSGFNIKEFLYTGHKEKKEGIELGAKFVSLNTLLQQSDFVLVVVPLTKETEGMCDADFFSKMKKTAVFVNVARGLVVDQPALINALKNGTIFAAGLDVMTPEPLPSDHELFKLPNVVLLPHIGSATYQTRAAMATLTAKNILKGLKNEEMLTPIV